MGRTCGDGGGVRGKLNTLSFGLFVLRESVLYYLLINFLAGSSSRGVGVLTGVRDGSFRGSSQKSEGMRTGRDARVERNCLEKLSSVMVFVLGGGGYLALGGS